MARASRSAIAFSDKATTSDVAFAASRAPSVHGSARWLVAGATGAAWNSWFTRMADTLFPDPPGAANRASIASDASRAASGTCPVPSRISSNGGAPDCRQGVLPLRPTGA
jgi:hypothetical protein